MIIELTTHIGEHLLVNVKNVAAFKEEGKSTKITYASGKTTFVRESYKRIRNILADDGIFDEGQ